jgi:tetratricopeptide (TPR) repeat protein
VRIIWLVVLGLTLLSRAPDAAEPAGDFARANQLYTRGRQLQMSGKEGDAAKVFASSLALVEKLLVAEPNNYDYIYLKSWNLFRLGRHEDVVALASRSLQAVRDYRIMEVMAESLYFLGRNEEALVQFASYTELAPVNDERMSSAYYYVGECYIRLKKFEHADIALSTATMLEKNMFYWWYRLASVKEILGQYRRAYEIFGKALALNQGYRPAQDGRARVKAKAGM